MTETTKQILMSAEFGPDYVKLTSKLDRTEYSKVDEALNRIQGKWNKKRGVHVFGFEPMPLVMAMVKSGKLPEKNPTAFFPTPAAAGMEAMRMAGLAHGGELVKWDGIKVNALEPSAGHGALAKLLRQALPDATIDTVEFLEINQQVLRDEGFDPFCGDFLEFNTDYKKQYRYIVMNPPFSIKGDPLAYITHILHAHRMLDEFGTLVAIVPPGFIQNKTKKEQDFYNMVLELGSLVDLPEDSFKESGTTINTCVIELSKKSWKEKPSNGYINHYAYDFRLTVDSDSKLHTEMQKMFSKMLNGNAFDKKEAEKFCIKAVDILNKQYHSLPPKRIDDYVSMLEWMFEMDYLEEIQEHPELMEPQPFVLLEKEEQEVVVKPKISIKEAKKATPTLFDLAS